MKKIKKLLSNIDPGAIFQNREKGFFQDTADAVGIDLKELEEYWDRVTKEAEKRRLERVTRRKG